MRDDIRQQLSHTFRIEAREVDGIHVGEDLLWKMIEVSCWSFALASCQAASLLAAVLHAVNTYRLASLNLGVSFPPSDSKACKGAFRTIE